VTLAMKYSELHNVGCARPFGPFLIAQWIDFILWRLFHYLETHYRYREFHSTLLDRPDQENNARVRSNMMRRLKIFACTSFVIMTFIGTLWSSRAQDCPKNLIPHLDLWIKMSWGICLFYVLMGIIGQKTVLIKNDLEMPYVREPVILHNRVEYGRSGYQDTIKGMPKRKIELIKKQKMNNCENLESTAMQFDSESSEEFWTVCSVCLEDITVEDWYKQLPYCGHYFHAECIDRWLTMQASCPVCHEAVEKAGEIKDIKRSPSCSFKTPRITFKSARPSFNPGRSLKYWMTMNGGSLANLSMSKLSMSGGSTRYLSMNEGLMSVNEGSTRLLSMNEGLLSVNEGSMGLLTINGRSTVSHL